MKKEVTKKILCCTACAVAAIILIVVGSHLYFANRIVASIPNPEVFLGISAQIDQSNSWNLRKTHYLFEFEEDPSDAVKAYVDLLASSEYPFVLNRSYESYEDEYFYLKYNGGKRCLSSSGYDVFIKNCGNDYYTYRDTYVVEIYIYNSGNFELIDAGRYLVKNYEDEDFEDSDLEGDDIRNNDTGNDVTGNDDTENDDSGNNDTEGKSSSYPSEKTLVAKELSSDSVSKEKSDAMDLLYYAQQEMSLDTVGPSGTSLVRGFSGTASDYDVLYAYVELLCAEYEFELVETPYYDDSGSTYTFVEFVLHYTGSKSMIGSGIGGTFTGNIGEVMIYAQIKRDTLKGAIWYDSALEMGDDGYVYGSSAGGKSYIGDSFGAGLYWMPDGSYQTTDGRLSASVGEAMLITDGTSTTFSADFTYDNDDNKQKVCVRNSYGTEQQVFYIPTTVTLASEQIYDSSYFIVESDWATKERGVSSGVPSYTWAAMFACLHDGNYIYPVRGLSGVMTDVNVRVMYVSESVAVFYTCAQFESSPYEVEALVAVAIGTDTVVENKPDGEYTISVGGTVDITGPSEFDTGYDLWAWEFVEGEDCAKLTGANAQICRVTGEKTGDVRVRVTYSYSVKEPDVLTGIERSVGHSTTREYVIHVE